MLHMSRSNGAMLNALCKYASPLARSDSRRVLPADRVNDLLIVLIEPAAALIRCKARGRFSQKFAKFVSVVGSDLKSRSSKRKFGRLMSALISGNIAIKLAVQYSSTLPDLGTKPPSGLSTVKLGKFDATPFLGFTCFPKAPNSEGTVVSMNANKESAPVNAE